MILLAITIKSLTIVFLTLLIIVMVLIGLVLLYGFRNFKLISNEAAWKKLIEEKIAFSIMEGVDSIRNDAHLVKLFGNKDFDKTFLYKLVESNKRFSGDAHGVLVELFYTFKMDELAFEEFRSKNKFKKMRGIEALTAMNVKMAVPEISLLLDYPDPLVVAEAQYAIVRFEDFKGIEFLSTFKSTLSEWQQMRLLRAISELPSTSLPLITDLLKNSNPSVITFVLSIIRKFRIFTLRQKVANLLTHKEPSIRVLAIDTLQDLEAENEILRLIDIYEEQEPEVKKAILLALKKSNNKAFSQFFKSKLMDSDTDLQLIAAEALVSNGELNYLQAQLEERDNSEKIHLIIKHALSIK